MIDLVLPATGTHGWHISEGWVEAARRVGLLRRVFRPRAEWGSESPSDDDGLLEALEGNQLGEMVLVLGMDWHSQPLTYTKRWRSAWRRSESEILAIIWEDYCSDFVQNNPQFKSQMDHAAQNMNSCVDWVYSNHEENIRYFNSELGFYRISYLPFSIDFGIIEKAGSDLGHDRKNAIFFKGKVDDFGYEIGPYQRRKELAEALRVSLGDRFKFSSNYVEDVDFIKLLSSYRYHINLPSFSPSMTLRAYEVMGTGGILLQFYPSGEVTRGLFKDGLHLYYYEPGDTEGVVEKAAALLEKGVGSCVGENAKQVVKSFHSMEVRFQTVAYAMADGEGDPLLARTMKMLVMAVRSGDVLCASLCRRQARLVIAADPSANAAAQDLLVHVEQKWSEFFDIWRRKKENTLFVFDAVFFQLARNGIARVWLSILEEFCRRGYKDSILVLDRGGAFDNYLGLECVDLPVVDWNRSPDEVTLEIDSAFEVPPGKDVVFMSSYYTSSSKGWNVQICHDMIPELLEGDEPVWIHKRDSFERADLIMCVSKNTRRDLLHYMPELDDHRVVTILNGLPSAIGGVVSESLSGRGEDASLLLVRAGVQPFDYFMFVGGRKGWKGYKNAIVLLRAFDQALLEGRLQDKRLLFVGGDEVLEQDLADQISDAARSRITIVKADDREYVTYLEYAAGLVYPSIYEGFGLPILEAFSVGCPVLSSRYASMPEVGGDVAYYFDPMDSSELKALLIEIGEARREGPDPTLIARARCFGRAWKFMVDEILDHLPVRWASTSSVWAPLAGRETDRQVSGVREGLLERIQNHYLGKA